MSKDYMTLKLGGKERGLKFTMGTFRFIGELAGPDPLKYDVTGQDLGSIYRTAKVVIHAALLNNLFLKKEQPDFTAEDVDIWISAISMNEVIGVLNAFAASQTTGVPEATNKKK